MPSSTDRDSQHPLFAARLQRDHPLRDPLRKNPIPGPRTSRDPIPRSSLLRDPSPRNLLSRDVLSRDSTRNDTPSKDPPPKDPFLSDELPRASSRDPFPKDPISKDSISRTQRTPSNFAQGQSCGRTGDSSSATDPKTDVERSLRDLLRRGIEREGRARRRRPHSANVSEFGPPAPAGAGARRKPCKRPRRRTRSLSASRRPPPSPAPTPVPTSAPPLSTCGTDLSDAGTHRERATKCLSQQIRIATPQYFACRNKIAALG